MAKTNKAKVTGAYVVKAAESRPSKVLGKSTDKRNTPSSADKALTSALIRAKSA